MKHYKGWSISYHTFGASWRAVRHGVSMCTNSEAGIKNMVDLKNAEMKQWREKGWN